METMEIPRDLIGVPEAAALLAVRDGFVRRLIDERRVTKYKVAGRQVRLSKAELLALVAITPARPTDLF